ncbi:MAG: Bacterial regulatory protein luxR family [Actinomycetota bacterium]|jgi:DNA-binding CsgD family transcriptional regulator|nr:Bacterial regulatory protein luxR family [Actinomycetota bacterium]
MLSLTPTGQGRFAARSVHTMIAPTCAVHPDSTVRRYRANGPNGPGVYPQCVPRDGAPAHLLDWEEVKHLIAAGVDTSRLSPSEACVLMDAANGLTVKESASAQHKGAETVKSQRRSVMLKLGARNMAQAVAMTSPGRSSNEDRLTIVRAA